MEELFATFIAPEVLSDQGRYSIITVWILFAAASIYGGSQVELNFNMEYFIPRDSILKGFVDIDVEHFQTGYNFNVYFVVDQLDIASEEAQLQILDW